MTASLPLRREDYAMRSCLLCLLSILLPWTASVQAAPPAEPLWNAAKAGNVEQVLDLLDAGIEVDAATEYGATALSFACDRGHVEVARVLIEHGANVNARDTFYKSNPLGWAISGGHHQVVALLLEHGASGRIKGLRTAASNGSLDVVKAILAAAPQQPVDLAAAADLAAGEGHAAVVEFLEAAGAVYPNFELPAQILDAYAGGYQSQTGYLLTFEHQEGKLVLSSDGLRPRKLHPVSPMKLRFGTTSYIFELKNDRITRVFVKQTSGTTAYDRIDPAANSESGDPTSNADPGDDIEPGVLADDRSVASPHWPSFRGLGARGIGDGQHPPLEWDVPANQGVRWKSPVPGLGHACPIVWGDRVFIATAVPQSGEAQLRTGLFGDVDSVADEPPQSWQVFCFNRDSGQILWRRTAHEGLPALKRHAKGTHANCTPCTDGRRLVVSFGSQGLYCYDLGGNLLWKRDLGPLESGWFYDPEYQWGFASSPVIYRDMVILQVDIQAGSHVIAYDLETGEPRWRTDRDEIPTWGTPTVYERDGVSLLVTGGSNHARGYNPANGEELWKLAGHSEIAVPTPVVAYGLTFISSGYRPIRPIYAVKLGATGDITLDDDQTSSEHIAWSLKQGGPYMPSPLAYRGRLYVCSNSGILACYNAVSGKRHYQKRITQDGAQSFTASPIAADGRIYFTSEEGIAVVVQDGTRFKVLSTNPVGESCLATPAITAGMLLIRTQKHLVAVGAEAPGTTQ